MFLNQEVKKYSTSILPTILTTVGGTEEKPKGNLNLPDNLNDTDENYLSQLLTHYSAYCSYLHYMVAKCKAIYEWSEEKVKADYNEKMGIAKGNTPSMRKISVLSNKEYIVNSQLLVELKNEFTMYSGLLESFKSKVHAVSREISLRGLNTPR